MEELHLSRYDFEKQEPASFAEQLRNSVKEVFEGAAKHSSGAKHSYDAKHASSEQASHERKDHERSILPVLAAGAALSLAAIVGWKQLAPRFARKAELNIAHSQGTALDEFANLAQQKAKLELDPSYRYFHQTRGDLPQIYRWPDNGLSLEKQSLSAVERYSNGVWKTNQREDLIHELARGWFHEQKDEISVQRAIELLRR